MYELKLIHWELFLNFGGVISLQGISYPDFVKILILGSKKYLVVHCGEMFETFVDSS